MDVFKNLDLALKVILNFLVSHRDASSYLVLFVLFIYVMKGLIQKFLAGKMDTLIKPINEKIDNITSMVNTLHDKVNNLTTTIDEFVSNMGQKDAILLKMQSMFNQFIKTNVKSKLLTVKETEFITLKFKMYKDLCESILDTVSITKLDALTKEEKEEIYNTLAVQAERTANQIKLQGYNVLPKDLIDLYYEGHTEDTAYFIKQLKQIIVEAPNQRLQRLGAVMTNFLSIFLSNWLAVLINYRQQHPEYAHFCSDKDQLIVDTDQKKQNN